MTPEPTDRYLYRLGCKHHDYGYCCKKSGWSGNAHLTFNCTGNCRRMKMWDNKHGFKGTQFSLREII